MMTLSGDRRAWRRKASAIVIDPRAGGRLGGFIIVVNQVRGTALSVLTPAAVDTPHAASITSPTVWTESVSPVGKPNSD